MIALQVQVHNANFFEVGIMYVPPWYSIYLPNSSVDVDVWDLVVYN